MAGEFNPDAYLSDGKTEFNPDAYLSGSPVVPDDDPYSPLQSGALGAVQGAAFDFADEIGGAGKATWDWVQGEGFDYKKNRDELRSEFEQAERENPLSYLGGNIAGSLAIPGGAMAKLGARGLKGAMAAGTIGGGIAGTGASRQEDVAGIAKDAIFGASVGAALPVGFKAAGAGLKGAAYLGKKLLPGFEGSLANKPASRIANILTRNVAGADDIHEFYSRPQMRKAVRSFDKESSISELRDHLESADEVINEKMIQKLSELKKDFLETPWPGQGGKAALDPTKKADFFGDALRQDMKAWASVGKKLSNFHIESQTVPKQFSAAYRRQLSAALSKMENNVSVTAKKSWQPGEYAKKTMHDIRKDLDKFKHKDLNEIELERVNDLRNRIDDALKYEVYGSEFRLKSDELYSTFMNQANSFLDMFKRYEGKGAFRKGTVDPQKVGSVFVKMAGKQGRVKQKAKLLSDFFEKNKDTLDMPEVKDALNSISNFNQKLDDARLMWRIDQLTGPTGTAVNLGLQTGLGVMTGGLSMLAIPVTAPGLWTKFIDESARFAAENPQLKLKLMNMVNKVEKGSSVITNAMARKYIREKDKKSFDILSKE